MSENHNDKQQKQQQNDVPAWSPELVNETEQNSSENSNSSDYTDSSDQPEPGTRAYLYYHRGEPYRTAQKAAKKAAKKRDQSLLDDPKFQRNMAYLTEKTAELEAEAAENEDLPETDEIDGITPINRDEIPHIGHKRYGKKGPEGSFDYPEVPSPPVPDDIDEDEGDVIELGSLPLTPGYNHPKNEYGDPIETEYEAVECLGRKKKTDGSIWYLIKFAQTSYGRNTHWCREEDCTNCQGLIDDWKKKQQKKLERNISRISAMSSDPSSASLSDSSSSSEDEDFTPPPTSSSSSSSSDTEDLEPCD